MKDAVVRARIDPELKAQAAAVLRANDLELSDAIRLVLRQVVLRRGGLPFAARDPAARVVSGKHLWAMKRKAQARDHELAARGEVPPAAMLLLRPERLRGAVVEWPDASLIEFRARSFVRVVGRRSSNSSQSSAATMRSVDNVRRTPRQKPDDRCPCSWCGRLAASRP
jgi:addiction module RelB/DinJ family antitoxin